MLTRLRQHAEAGETLVELLITIVILGAIVVSFGTAIALSIRISAIHRAQAVADAFLHNYAETLEGSYKPCAAAVDPLSYYNSSTVLAPPVDGNGVNWSTNKIVTALSYWDSSTMKFDVSDSPGSPCPSAGDPGLQQVTLVLESQSGAVSESLVVVLRGAS